MAERDNRSSEEQHVMRLLSTLTLIDLDFTHHPSFEKMLAARVRRRGIRWASDSELAAFTLFEASVSKIEGPDFPRPLLAAKHLLALGRYNLEDLTEAVEDSDRSLRDFRASAGTVTKLTRKNCDPYGLLVMRQAIAASVGFDNTERTTLKAGWPSIKEAARALWSEANFLLENSDIKSLQAAISKWDHRRKEAIAYRRQLGLGPLALATGSRETEGPTVEATLRDTSHSPVVQPRFNISQYAHEDVERLFLISKEMSTFVPEVSMRRKLYLLAAFVDTTEPDGQILMRMLNELRSDDVRFSHVAVQFNDISLLIHELWSTFSGRSLIRDSGLMEFWRSWPVPSSWTASQVQKFAKTLQGDEFLEAVRNTRIPPDKYFNNLRETVDENVSHAGDFYEVDQEKHWLSDLPSEATEPTASAHDVLNQFHHRLHEIFPQDVPPEHQRRIANDRPLHYEASRLMENLPAWGWGMRDAVERALVNGVELWTVEPPTWTRAIYEGLESEGVIPRIDFAYR